MRSAVCLTIAPRPPDHRKGGGIIEAVAGLDRGQPYGNEGLDRSMRYPQTGSRAARLGPKELPGRRRRGSLRRLLIGAFIASSLTGTFAATPLGATIDAGSSGGVHNLLVTHAVKEALVAAFAPVHHVRVSEIEGTSPGSVFYAYDPGTRTYWAEAFFVPASGDSQAIKDTFQDAGADGIFSRVVSGSWRFRGNGAPLSCTADQLVPHAVLRLWGSPLHTPGCR